MIEGRVKAVLVGYIAILQVGQVSGLLRAQPQQLLSLRLLVILPKSGENNIQHFDKQIRSKPKFLQ